MISPPVPVINVEKRSIFVAFEALGRWSRTMSNNNTFLTLLSAVWTSHRLHEQIIVCPLPRTRTYAPTTVRTR